MQIVIKCYYIKIETNMNQDEFIKLKSTIVTGYDSAVFETFLKPSLISVLWECAFCYEFWISSNITQYR